VHEGQAKWRPCVCLRFLKQNHRFIAPGGEGGVGEGGWVGEGVGLRVVKSS
jgi:hypothetical protein